MPEKTLSTFIESVCGDSHLRVETDFGDGYVRLKSAEAEKRQAAHDIRSTEDIVIEMLRNARDAHAKNIFLALSREQMCRRLILIDDGDGIPLSMHTHIFEPRVTSKLDSMHLDKWGIHGRGMALYSIAVNAEDARVVTSLPGKGSSFFVETNLDTLSERTDQSTFPSFEVTESGAYSMRGPRNIVRTACEFALEHRHQCNVYCGSITEIAATLYEFARVTLSLSLRTFCTDEEEIHLCKRLAVATDPADFVDRAQTLGLSLSERSARRIMNDEIKPLDTLVDELAKQNFSFLDEEKKRAVSASSLQKITQRDKRGLKIAQDDLALFKQHIRKVFAELAHDYYLEEDVDPVVKVSKDTIRITIPVEKLR